MKLFFNVYIFTIDYFNKTRKIRNSFTKKTAKSFLRGAILIMPGNKKKSVYVYSLTLEIVLFVYCPWSSFCLLFNISRLYLSNFHSTINIFLNENLRIFFSSQHIIDPFYLNIFGTYLLLY